MGFGLLFIGYLFTYLLSMAGAYGCYPAIIGCLVMLYALTKLLEYEKTFKYAFFGLIPVTVCTVYSVAVQTFTSLGVRLPAILGSQTLEIIMTYSKALFNLVFNVLLLYAISVIAKSTGVERTQKAALRNIVIYGVYFLTVLLNESLPSDMKFNLYVFWAALALSVLVLVLNGTVIFSCYMRICDEGDEDMARKESRFEFINKINKEFDRREEKAQRESRERHEARLSKRAERKKRKK